MAYSTEEKENILNKIFTEIQNGRAVRNVLKDEGMPDVTTFYRWIEDDAEKAKQYARACEVRADAIFDEIIDIADDKRLDITYSEAGVQTANTEFIARSRVRIDARKWIASKLNPKKYGDKTILSGDKENPIQTITAISVNIEKPLEDDD